MEFAADNSKLIEIGRNFSTWEENTAGKGEIARYEQFLLFPQSFQKDLFCRPVKSRACLGKGQEFNCSVLFSGEPKEIQYSNDILAMISPENEKVSLGKVSIFL